MNSVDDWSTEIRSAFCKHVDPVGDGFLLLDSQCRPPLKELIGDLNFPHP